ncbi:MAG: PspA/IM30 family protein [Deltaproteobacteria bacterium]|nr:PspA/IM30 family protein [Deltaproteobacteria bacterium]MCB9788078.1 PspA/IM30 family protein [Deltaproteobacteria bacterium]
MSIFQRMSTLIKSNINSLISKAEDPEKILNQLIIDMKSQFLEARKMVAVAIADEKRLKRQYETELGNAQDWEKKAMTAVRAGRDDLGRQALQRKAEHDSLAEQFQQQWIAQKQAADQLKDALTQLNAKIQEAQRKKNLLIARQKRAEAQKTIQDTMSGMNDTGAFDSFARMEEKVDRMEAEAEAATELGQHTMGDSLESELKALEASPAGQDDALAALKAKMGVAPPVQAALPAGGAGESVESDQDIEAELEALLKESK